MDLSFLEKMTLKPRSSEAQEEQALNRKIRKAFSQLKAPSKRKKSISGTRGGLISKGARGVFVKEANLYSRNVIVKAKYIQNKSEGFKEKVRAHLQYISRDHAGEHRHKPELFCGEGIKTDVEECIKNLTDANHNFRFIISPEDGDKLDLKNFSIELIKKIEKDIGTSIDWVAACHYDTNEPHVHVVINGKDKTGKDLLFTRDYISRGIKSRASEIVNRKLGIRTPEEVMKSLELTIAKDQKTPLDTLIQKNLTDDALNTSTIKIGDYPQGTAEAIHARLHYLSTKGLASSEGNEWRIVPDFVDRLEDLRRHQALVNIVNKTDKVNADSLVRITKDSTFSGPIEGFVVARGFRDELSNEEYLLVKNTAGKTYYVELEKYSEKHKIKKGDLVELNQTKPFSGPMKSDFTVEAIAQGNGGIYDATVHRQRITKLPPEVSKDDFINVHLKRLEVLARMGFVEKCGENIFRIPQTFIKALTQNSADSKVSFTPHLKVTLKPDQSMTLRRSMRKEVKQ